MKEWGGGREFRIDSFRLLFNVGSLYCRSEIYAGRVACFPFRVTSMPTGQTDGRETVTLRFPLDAESVKNRSKDYVLGTQYTLRANLIVVDVPAAV